MKACDTGYYLDSSTWTCKACSSDCETCSDTGNDKCDTCLNGRTPVSKKCKCDTGNKYNKDSNACEADATWKTAFDGANKEFDKKTLTTVLEFANLASSSTDFTAIKNLFSRAAALASSTTDADKLTKDNA